MFHLMEEGGGVEMGPMGGERGRGGGGRGGVVFDLLQQLWQQMFRQRCAHVNDVIRCICCMASTTVAHNELQQQ